MAAEIEFRLLGPLEVRRGGKVVPVDARRQRTVLAALLLKPGRVVGVDELAGVLWGDEPPRTAKVSTQNYVMRLRNALGDLGRERIRTQPGGYLISVHAGELDVARFESLIEAARAAAKEQAWETSATEADEALSLWRGEPLADAGSEALALVHVPRLTELRLEAAELRADAHLRRGRHRELIGELRQLAGEHPLRERLHGLLMVALGQDGRPGEALAVYQETRRVLVDELGTEPGVALRSLHQRLLAGDPVLAEPTTQADLAAPRDSPRRAVPRQLPASVRHFTGRSDELAALAAFLGPAGDHALGTVLITAIGGTPGVGKTALALRWAHQVAGLFPDGQLYANLRGYDPGHPMPAADALAAFLRALGVPGQEIPAETDERAAKYRSLLAGRRMLVVLDNAGSEEQVRPLLPASPGSATLVTSRDALAGLVARDGADRIELGLLPMPDAAELLRALIGPRADAEPDAVRTLAGHCGRLPLALRVAAELAAARPAASLAELAAELSVQQRKLDLLEAGGDRGTAVRAVFSWSCRHLDPATVRAFALAGLHPGPELDAYAVAALTGSTPEAADRALGQLARGHLIQLIGPGRYAMHDLLRAYAAELALAEDGSAPGRAALTRLLDYYVHTTAAATETAYPAERHHRPPVDPSSTPGRPLADGTAARAWLEAERATLAAVVEFAADGDWPGHATAIAGAIGHHLDVTARYPEAIAVHAWALRAARRTDDRSAQAAALIGLGRVDWRQGRYGQARDRLDEALILSGQAGDTINQAHALTNLGSVEFQLGNYSTATDRHQQARALCRQAGDLTGEAYALCGLGLVGMRQGDYSGATGHLVEALAASRRSGDQPGEARALAAIGEAELMQGRHDEATSYLSQALVIHSHADSPANEAPVHANLGRAELRQGRYLEAAGHLRHAIALYQKAGDRTGEAYALGVLGDAQLRQGHYDLAASNYRQTLALCRDIGDRINEACALGCLGDVALAQGRPRSAAGYQEQALELFRLSGDRIGEAEALNGYGEALLADAQADGAQASYASALTLAEQIGDQHQQARALDGLAHIHLAAGDPGQARDFWQQALSRYTGIGAPEALAVRARLSALTPG